VRFLVEHAEVEREHRQHEQREAGVEPPVVVEGEEQQVVHAGPVSEGIGIIYEQ
jgi:hypothetical protein